MTRNSASLMVHWDSLRCSSLLIVITCLLLLPGWTLAEEQAPFDCHVTTNGVSFDLTRLSGEHSVSRTRKVPPTTMEDILRFNLCSDLEYLEDVAKDDQCPKGARACLTSVNHKPPEPDRIVSVVTLANASSTRTVTAGLSDQKYISILFNGPDYSSPSESTPTEQFLNVTIFCNPNPAADPKFVSYDNSVLTLEWAAPEGCPSERDSEPPKIPDDQGDPKEENVGSGLGWFFLVIFLVFVAYFAVGAYYNYSTYGARGVDLIPHRDFWQEVPYMLKDVVSHLCSSVHPRRSSRGGYVAV